MVDSPLQRRSDLFTLLFIIVVVYVLHCHFTAVHVMYVRSCCPDGASARVSSRVRRKQAGLTDVATGYSCTSSSQNELHTISQHAFEPALPRSQTRPIRHCNTLQCRPPKFSLLLPRCGTTVVSQRFLPSLHSAFPPPLPPWN